MSQCLGASVIKLVLEPQCLGASVVKLVLTPQCLSASVVKLVLEPQRLCGKTCFCVLVLIASYNTMAAGALPQVGL